MLFRLTSARRAANVPLFMLAFSAFVTFGAVAAVIAEVTLWTVGLCGFALLVFSLVLAQVRRIRVVGDELVTNSLFASQRMSLSKLAIGERVRHSRGHHYYDLYAYDGEQEFDLADAMSARGSARARAKLEALIGSPSQGGPVSEEAAAARAVVAGREAKYAQQQAAAQKVVDDYYKSGSGRYVPVVILGLVALFAIVSGVYVYLGGNI